MGDDRRRDRDGDGRNWPQFHQSIILGHLVEFEFDHTTVGTDYDAVTHWLNQLKPTADDTAAKELLASLNDEGGDLGGSAMEEDNI